MGLDIYVRFGDEDDNWYKPDSPNHDYYQDQMTGFSSAPYAGYLRESWGSLRWVGEASKKYDGPNPYGFFPDWEGWNGEELRCDNGNLGDVLAFRDNILRPYLRDNEKRNAVYAKIKREIYGTEDIDEILTMPTQQREELEAKRQEGNEAFNAYRRRVADAIGFINFLEIHKDKPNLIVVFG